MKLKIGQIIIDTLDDLNDVGIVTEIEEYNNDTIYRIYWTCHRPEGKDYSTTILYSEEELKMEYSQHFVTVE